MDTLKELVRRMISLRKAGKAQMTLLAVCPNSAAVLESAVKVAARTNAPLLFAATLNQVDRDGGYTGWTPKTFVQMMGACRDKYHCLSPLYPCLDHGGPWLKDMHSLAHLTFPQTMAEVKRSLTACLEAGYSLLHIDATVDRSLPPGEIIAVDLVVSRTLELIEYCEGERRRLNLSAVSYEVGTEEVRGGLANPENLDHFVHAVNAGLHAKGLTDCWPCFIAGKVGTDVDTTYFDAQTARKLYDIVSPHGSLIKGYYTDWVSNPEAYPDAGMGGANVGPEFTIVEFQALAELAMREADLLRGRPTLTSSSIMRALESAVVDSGRWQKWLNPKERAMAFAGLPAKRRRWLVQTGARYVWMDEPVQAARETLYRNLSAVMDAHAFVIERIAVSIEKYITQFHLFDAISLLA